MHSSLSFMSTNSSWKKQQRSEEHPPGFHSMAEVLFWKTKQGKARSLQKLDKSRIERKSYWCCIRGSWDNAASCCTPGNHHGGIFDVTTRTPFDPTSYLNVTSSNSVTSTGNLNMCLPVQSLLRLCLGAFYVCFPEQTCESRKFDEPGLMKAPYRAVSCRKRALI